MPQQPNGHQPDEKPRYYIDHRRQKGSRNFVVIDRETHKPVGKGYRFRGNAAERIRQLELDLDSTTNTQEG